VPSSFRWSQRQSRTPAHRLNDAVCPPAPTPSAAPPDGHAASHDRTQAILKLLTIRAHEPPEDVAPRGVHGEGHPRLEVSPVYLLCPELPLPIWPPEEGVRSGARNPTGSKSRSQAWTAGNMWISLCILLHSPFSIQSRIPSSSGAASRGHTRGAAEALERPA
jgi:hypothetical protein